MDAYKKHTQSFFYESLFLFQTDKWCVVGGGEDWSVASPEQMKGTLARWRTRPSLGGRGIPTGTLVLRDKGTLQKYQGTSEVM